MGNHYGAKNAPRPTVRRLPSVLQYLKRMKNEGLSHISSAKIAEALDLESIQVRKDLQVTGLSGQPGVGFEIEALIEAIERFLGWDNNRDAFVVGAGNLGAALSGYSGFSDYGLNIAALFDVNDDKVGMAIHGKEVFHTDRLIDLAWRMHVKIGILTVSADAAQKTAELMVDAGIRAIWNFTTVNLDLPATIAVEKVDLAASLAVLSKRLDVLMDNDKHTTKV